MNSNYLKSDATATYRGYRLQSLYTLVRILENQKRDLIFQPEGAEDLAIFDMKDCLLETIQVKAYTANLTLSLLEPKKKKKKEKDSFFYRVNDLRGQYPNLSIKIVSFSRAPELLQARQGEGNQRDSVVNKIVERVALSKKDVRTLLSKLELVFVVEDELEKKVFATIRNVCTGIDPVPAFEMLSFWLYACAENKSKITRDDVIQRINDVGRFIAERNARHQEWFRSIIPIENREVDSSEIKKLSNEFYRGISARYEHILANVDKRRPSRLAEISQKFKETQVVIVRGASGQGKTTLAYRYLHDFFPDFWRFQVSLVEGRQHALNIATALSGQAKAIKVPIAVYLDVSPSDEGWLELVKQLTLHKNIQVLVTVREEDFKKAQTSISGAELQFSEVELKFDRSEAEEIYEFLRQTAIPNQFLDFDDAWNRFGGEGPLMEFVYLVAQGETLRERLSQQVKRIEDEVRAGKRSDAELELLRLVSVASAFEARLKLREVVKSLSLSAPRRTIELLEKEYLLRTSENGALVGGLHPIRSTILADILATFYPWIESASSCLPYIFEQDVGSFLLYAFSRHRSELEPLLDALKSYQPEQWIAIAGVIRALIWLGIKEYVETNQKLIADIYNKRGGWVFILDFDIADAMPGAADSFLSLPVISEDTRSQIEALRSQQTDRSQIFVRATKWLSCLTQKPLKPQFELDWIGMAEVLFWSGRLKVTLPIAHWLSDVDLDKAVETLSLEILADVALGLFYGYKTGYQSWLKQNKTRLINRFRRKTQTVVWEDDGENIRVHFVMEMFKPDFSNSETESFQKNPQKGFMDASIERLKLCRRFFPDREGYGSQGYGHQIWGDTKLPDETNRNILRSDLPLQWLVSLNSIFRVLGERDLHPETWEEYASNVLKLREEILQVLEQLIKGLDVFFKPQKKDTQILGKYLKSSLWTSTKKNLISPPKLPRCAFDEWGFVSEGMDPSQKSNINVFDDRRNLALGKYNSYLKSFNEYDRVFFNFFEQSEWVLNFNPYFRGESNIEPQELAEKLNVDLTHIAHLSVVNLGDALTVLPKLQEEFRKLLSQFVDEGALKKLEKSEREIFKEVWCMWYCFAFHPTNRFKNPKKECVQKFNKKVKEIRNSISKELETIPSESVEYRILSEEILWENEGTLWLVIDGKNPFDVYNSLESVLDAIRRGISNVHASELRRYAIDFTWQKIAIVPLVQGKSLDGTAWRFSSILLSVNPEQDLGLWNFVPVSIPENSVSQLGISIWRHPRLAVAKNLTNSISQLSNLVSHIQDFQRLPELDELGQELLQKYIEQLAVLLGEVFQSVLDAKLQKMVDFFHELPPLEQENRPYLIEAMQILIKLYEEIRPTRDCSKGGKVQVTMSLAEIFEWGNRLKTVQQLVPQMYQFLVSDILAELETDAGDMKFEDDVATGKLDAL